MPGMRSVHHPRSALIAALFAGAVAAQGDNTEPPAEAPSAAHRLRLMTYNVRHGAGMDGVVDLDRTAAVILAAGADVVCLQEIDRGTGRTNGVDQARALGARTGMHAEFGAFMPYDGGEYGMATLSRLPVERVDNLRLPAGAEPRTALLVTVRHGDSDRRLTIANVHFYATEEQRSAQARTLLAAIDSAPAPVVVAGDFNSRPGSAVMQLFADGWTSTAGAGAPHTFPADRPDRTIDAILVPNGAGITAQAFAVIAEPHASDHRPLRCDLLLGATAKARASRQPPRSPQN